MWNWGKCQSIILLSEGERKEKEKEKEKEIWNLLKKKKKKNHIFHFLSTL